MTKIEIDSSIWITATDFAKERTATGTPTTPQMVSNWKRRNLIEFKHFKSIGKDLVNKHSLKLKNKS